MMRRRNNRRNDTSSSCDEDWKVDLQRRRKRKCCPRINNYIEIISRYSDNEFKSYFRMCRDTFDFLHDILAEDLMRRAPGCLTIPSRHQLMIALWKIATMDSYGSVCNRFNVGRATAVRAVRRVTHALFERAPNFIQWPLGNRAIDVIRGFEVSSGFPKTIGAIDGTYISIDAPKVIPADYVNRKGYHSVQLQLVCDHRSLLTHCYVGHPGSVHDRRVFRLSEVSNYLYENENFPENSHILGDAAYELHQHLLTPFCDNGHLTERQKRYNHYHSMARVMVERCIGLLKGRMRSLLHCLPMTRIDLMAEYIVACCVIHNICILRGDEIVEVAIAAAPVENIENNNIHHQVIRNAGVLKRNVIVNNLQ
ncbi:putative nuclease HARBI1 isoform X2 [Athalia rosae]|nr:putative nuclease HARBI1 isoform X2 [Athalia rosae]